MIVWSFYVFKCMVYMTVSKLSNTCNYVYVNMYIDYIYVIIYQYKYKEIQNY